MFTVFIFSLMPAMNDFNEISLNTDSLVQFLMAHRSVIQREIEISLAEIKSAPIEMKTFFLEKYNLYKALELFIETNNVK